MPKLTIVANIIAWVGVGAFGVIIQEIKPGEESLLLMALLGFCLTSGIWASLVLSRSCTQLTDEHSSRQADAGMRAWRSKVGGGFDVIRQLETTAPGGSKAET